MKVLLYKCWDCKTVKFNICLTFLQLTVYDLHLRKVCRLISVNANKYLFICQFLVVYADLSRYFCIEHAIFLTVICLLKFIRLFYQLITLTGYYYLLN